MACCPGAAVGGEGLLFDTRFFPVGCLSRFVLAGEQDELVGLAALDGNGDGDLLSAADEVPVGPGQEEGRARPGEPLLVWIEQALAKLEHARRELRSIMKYRQSGTGPGYAIGSTRTGDDNIQINERKVVIAGANEAMIYRRRLKDILDQMLVANPTLQKIHKGEPIAEPELKTLTSTILTSHPGVSLDVLNEFYGRTADQLHLTVREIIGLDAQAIEEHFKGFLHAHPSLTAQQVRFMNLLKNYIAQHGSIVVEKLYEPPFDSISHEGIDGVFAPEDVGELVAVLKPFLRADSAPAA